MSARARLHVSGAKECVPCGSPPAEPRCPGHIADISVLPGLVGHEDADGNVVGERYREDERLVAFRSGYVRSAPGKYDLTKYAVDSVAHHAGV